MSSRANSDPTQLSTLVRTHLERPFPTTSPLQSTTKTSIFCLPSTPHLFSRQALRTPNMLALTKERQKGTNKHDVTKQTKTHNRRDERREKEDETCKTTNMREERAHQPHRHTATSNQIRPARRKERQDTKFMFSISSRTKPNQHISEKMKKQGDREVEWRSCEVV